MVYLCCLPFAGVPLLLLALRGPSPAMDAVLAESALADCSGGASASTARVAFAGNSFTYYNDLPHLVESILSWRLGAAALTTRSAELDPSGWSAPCVRVGACLRGGADLASLWREGAREADAQFVGGTRDWHHSFPALLAAPGGWDAVVLQDHSLGATPGRLGAGLRIIREHLAPLLAAMRPRVPLVVLYQTWAFPGDGVPKNDAALARFTRQVAEGYASYGAELRSFGLNVTIAKAGEALLRVRERGGDALWRRMFSPDNKHPSPAASYLNAALLADAIAVGVGLLGASGERLKRVPDPAGGTRWPPDTAVHPTCAPLDDTDLEEVLRLGGLAAPRKPSV